MGFAPGSEYDIQRSYGGVTPGFNEGGDRFVSSFTNAASFVYGAACGAIGITQTDCLQGGGLTKLGTTLSTTLKGNFSQVIGGISDWFNPPQNATNIRTGYSYVSGAVLSAPTGFTPVTAPSGSATRVSANYITDTNPNDHAVTIKAGGTVWDAYVTQQNSANGISNWNDFQSAVTVCNPNIANLNNVSVGTTLYLPQKMSDGSLTYHYAGGASINNNAATGEYYMVIPDGSGGTSVYSKTRNIDGSYAIGQTDTNRYGEETFMYDGTQNALTGDIKAGALLSGTDTNGDGKIDQFSLSADTNHDGLLDGFITTGSKQSDLFTADKQLDWLHDLDLIGDDLWDNYTTWSTSQLFTSTLTLTAPAWTPSSTYHGKEAFYQVVTPILDTAGAVSGKTFRILNSANQAITAAQLTALDANRDGKLSGAELNGLMAWADLNEDGINQGGELTTLATALANAGQNSVRASDYAFYVTGNASYRTPAQQAAPTLAAPASNYSTLRSTDNRFYVTPTLWIDWSANQIKLSSNQLNMVGTEGNDNFDINWYAAYHGKYFNLALVQNFYAGGGNDVMGGSNRNDNLWGGTGHDTLWGYDGDDNLYGEDGNDLLFGQNGNDTLMGGAGNDELQGGAGNDQLDGGTGDDRLFGQIGNDVMNGGDGNDVMLGFTASNDAKQTLAAGESDDDLMYGGAGDDFMQGGLGSDQLWGGIGNDELQGGDGNDALYGEDGNDRLFGGSGDDILYGGNGDDLIVGGVASNEAALSTGISDNNFLYGGAGNDTILGGNGHDFIDGGAGADNMEGGKGDDTYLVNSVNDVILEQQNEGYDTVISSANTLLNAHIEELRLVEGFTINGTGNSLDNKIIGNGQDNLLDGVTGADTMIGGLGNDTYTVDNAGDQVIEVAGEGTDTVAARISYALGANVENLTLLDFSKPEAGLVDGRNVLVYGYPKAYELDYMQGDAIAGYKGTCALTSIANLATQANEAVTEAQVVRTAIDNGWCVTDATTQDFHRGSSNYLQQQALLASYGIRNGVIQGYNEQATANLIKGGRGVILAVNAGKLWGGSANANYDYGVVDHVVTVTGVVCDAASGAINGFYIADSGRGLVTDMTRYLSLADFRAAAHVGLAYTLYSIDPIKLWEENINATGNELANVITGNRGDNILTGNKDNDTLIGMAGNDTYRFARGDGQDTVIDIDASVGNTDVLQLTNINQTNLWFRHVGSDLQIDVLGSSDRITLKDWYVNGASGTDNHIERIKTADGLTMYDTDVERFVQAMAAFAPPTATQTNWTNGQATNGKVLLTVTH